MIHQVKISFEVTAKADGGLIPTDSGDQQDPYKELTSLISGLDECPGHYCLVVQVINSHFLADTNPFCRQLEALMRILTRRELEILDLVMNGFLNRDIAEKLSISLETLKSHRKNIVGKAGTKNMEEIKTWLLKARS